MWVIALEALVALTLLIVIVWMTLGSARRKETPQRDAPPQAPHPPVESKPPSNRDA